MQRSTRKTVTFAHPFHLIGIDGILAPGSYEIETIEEQLDGLSFTAYRRVSTTVLVCDSSTRARQVTEIDPDDLAAALSKDKMESDARSACSS